MYRQHLRKEVIHSKVDIDTLALWPTYLNQMLNAEPQNRKPNTELSTLNHCSMAQVRFKTAAGVSSAAMASLAGSCAGTLTISSVSFGEGSSAVSWAQPGDSDVVLTVEITVGT